MVNYMGALFDWDGNKDAANRKKHGVSFEEAMTAFSDEHAQIYDDAGHSGDEERFVLIGYSEKPRLLVVCHCYRGGDDVTRIISARKADARERRKYETGGW